MSKGSAALSIFVALGCLLYYGMKWQDFNQKAVAKSFKFELPKVSGIVKKQPTKYLFGNFSVWGLKSPRVQKGGAPEDEMSPGGSARLNFVYKEVAGTPSLCRVGDGAYCWEYFGTLERDQTRFAIFYNSALKIIKLVKSSEALDTGLTVERLSANEVQVKRKGGDTVTLKIFALEGNQRE